MVNNMDDKITPMDSSSEYKFSDSEGVEPIDIVTEEQQNLGTVNTEDVKASSRFKLDLKNINWRRVSVPAVMVLAILFIYGTSSFLSSKKTRELEQKKSVLQEETVLAQQRRLLEAEAAKPVVSSVAATANDRDQQITQMQRVVQQKIDGVMQLVKNEQDSVSTVNEAVSKIEQNVVTVSKQVEQLTIAMGQMLAEIDKLKVSPKKNPKKVVSKLPVAYRVRAIIPGRVWLDSADGKSVTLRVGDRLSGYGTVKTIVPHQGMVVMSNGSIIQYGVNDF